MKIKLFYVKEILIIFAVFMILCTIALIRDLRTPSFTHVLEYRDPAEISFKLKQEPSIKFYNPKFKSLFLNHEDIIEKEIELIIEEVKQEVNTSYVSTQSVVTRTVDNSIYFTEDQISRIPSWYTLDEVRMFCTMVYGECGAITNQVSVTFYDENNDAIKTEMMDASFMHKLCASVLLNRIKDSRFPDTIYKNLVMPKQYTVLYTYESQSYSYYSGTGSNWCNIVNEVIECLNGEFTVPENVIFQSNFSNLGTSYYASIYVDTGWFRSTSYYAYG